MALNLTDGEKAVLERLSNGFERKEIAKDLNIAVSTVHNRIYDAIKRNGCRTSYHLLAWFVRDAVLGSVLPRDSRSETGEGERPAR
jgi:DNA-binding NarL/FixJ family response regulator